MMFTRRPPIARTISATGRVDTRTKRLVSRLQPGEIAVIDHTDIDRVAAEALIDKRPVAVLNAADSISGRYPNVGATLLTQQNILLLDGLGPEIMTIAEGTFVTVDDSTVKVDGDVIATGTRQTAESIHELVEDAKVGLSAELQAFAENTLRYVQEESHLLFDPPDPPDLGLEFKGRHVIVVVRGHDYHHDLLHLRSYVREVRPIIIAVDGGADVCLQEGLKPHIIIGDFDSVSDDALRCGAKLVVHAYVGGKAPGAQRVQDLGLEYATYEAPGMSEDVAMLLAYDEGAELIVAVGTHASMIEFLDKGRAGMASTFLTRLKVGPKLVDAKGVSRLYHGTVRKSDLAFLVGSAFVVLVVIGLVSYPVRTFVAAGWFLIARFIQDIFEALTPW